MLDFSETLTNILDANQDLRAIVIRPLPQPGPGPFNFASLPNLQVRSYLYNQCKTLVRVFWTQILFFFSPSFMLLILRILASD